MKSVPPRLLEAIIGKLLPPACREPVLGDLYERCTSLRQYLVDALLIVPRVILSRIHRSTDPQSLTINAAALYLSFLAAAWWQAGSPFLYSQLGVLKAAIPAVIAMVALSLKDAYADPARPSHRKPQLDATFALACAYLSQAVLLVLRSDLLLPGRIMLSGSGASLLLLTLLRKLFVPIEPSGMVLSEGVTSMSLKEIQEKSQNFTKSVRRSNLALLAGVAVTIAVGWLVDRKGALAPTLSARLAAGIIVAAAAYVLYQLYRKGPVETLPVHASLPASVDLYRAQLGRRRDALLSIWSWYASPLLVILLTIGLHLPIEHHSPWFNAAPFLVNLLVLHDGPPGTPGSAPPAARDRRSGNASEYSSIDRMSQDTFPDLPQAHLQVRGISLHPDLSFSYHQDQARLFICL